MDMGGPYQTGVFGVLVFSRRELRRRKYLIFVRESALNDHFSCDFKYIFDALIS